MIRKSAAILMAVEFLTLSGAVARADTQPTPTPGPAWNAPKCVTFDGTPPLIVNYLPCGWTTDGRHWIPRPPS
ncbi:hypothetical protein MRAB57_2589 [Mycobacterium rhizamassiliense]|jgi:hypothetical protein|uniref:Secreted protein n=1 Tax=Mycobacterium rhizamassiliense TaxID=1841860 RepID=A0A2U3NTD7_9MYCO|nr:hypothetical protein MRAB57_2589 [Mycobacterium rhizamassiliense]